MIAIEPLRFDAAGLLPVVVQDAGSGAVLMLAYANREAVEKTLATRQAWFWSRSRQSLWNKGETSGNTLQVLEVTADCDGDALLVRALPAGPACHRGTRSCFEPNPARLELGWLAEGLASRPGADPRASSTGGPPPRRATRPACSPAASRASPRRWGRRGWRPPSPPWSSPGWPRGVRERQM